MTRILFICLGNICRSPAAEAVLRVKARKRGMEIYVDSAGTGAWHQGDPADARMLRAAARRGYDLSYKHARQIDLADFYSFDYFLAMDLRNQTEVLAMAPPNRGCDIRLFLDFSDADLTEVPDPYYGGAQGFERALDLIERGADSFLDHLEDES